MAVIALLLPSSIRADEKWDLAFLSQVTADSSRLTVRDIIDSQRTSASLLERYGQIALPQTGGDGSLQPSHILLALSRAGVDLSKINLLTSSEIRINGAPRGDVLSMIKDKILKKFKESSSEIVSQVSFTDVPLNLPPKDSFFDFDVEIRVTPGTKEYVFIASFRDVENRVTAASELKGIVEMDGKVVVARRPIMKGEYVTAADFEESTRPIEGQTGYVTSLSELGQSRWQVGDTMEQGQLLTKNILNFSSAVKKGAVVTLLSGDRRFQIRALGRVLEVMDNGASVLVQNIDSKKELFGQPISASEVKIVY